MERKGFGLETSNKGFESNKGSRQSNQASSGAQWDERTDGWSIREKGDGNNVSIKIIASGSDANDG